MYLLMEYVSPKEYCLASHKTYYPCGCISNIRSFTRSPISLFQAFTRSFWSLRSGHAVSLNVANRSFFIYARNDSESNFGLGEAAFEREGGGERRPVGERVYEDMNMCVDVFNESWNPTTRSKISAWKTRKAKSISKGSSRCKACLRVL